MFDPPQNVAIGIGNNDSRNKSKKCHPIPSYVETATQI